jgi:hypothetical protein
MIDAAQGVVPAAGSVITQYPEPLPTTPPAPARPSLTPSSEQRFTPNNSQNDSHIQPKTSIKDFGLALIQWETGWYVSKEAGTICRLPLCSLG